MKPITQLSDLLADAIIERLVCDDMPRFCEVYLEIPGGEIIAQIACDYIVSVGIVRGDADYSNAESAIMRQLGSRSLYSEAEDIIKSASLDISRLEAYSRPGVDW